MRKIKFRAWIPEDELDDFGYVPENRKFVMCYDLAFEDFEPINDLLSRVDNLMQFTGLLDNNRKEIYEGDILNITIHELDDSFDTTYQVLWDNRHGGFSLKPISLMTQKNFFEHCCPEELEVIGNVFENPELLKNHSS